MGLMLPKRHDLAIEDYAVPDEDFYALKFLGYDDPVASAYQDKTTGDYPMRLRLRFEIVDDDDFGGDEVSGYWDLAMNANRTSSIYHVVAALTGDEVAPDDEIDLDRLKGKTCRGRVVHKKKPSREDPSRILTFANIAEVKSAKRNKKKAAPPVADDGDDDDPFADDDE